MPGETVVFLKWDGLCVADPKTAPTELWRNSRSIGEGSSVAPTPPSDSSAQLAVSDSQSVGPVLSVQRARVTLVSASDYFAPCEEWCAIKISVMNIDKAGTLVLQIRDADDKLVYAERLTQKQIWGLPKDDYSLRDPPLGVQGVFNDKEKAKRLADRRKLAWASPVQSPYKVTVLLADAVDAELHKVAGTPALDADPSGLQTDSGTVTKNSVKAVDPPPDPKPPCAADETSVQLTGEITIEAADSADFNSKSLWPNLYMEASGDDHYPVERDEIAGLAADKKLLWVKCRLNEIGFYAGPITSKADDPDFERAVRRYGTMRAITGKCHYKVADDVPVLHDRPKGATMKRGAATPSYDALMKLETGFKLDDLATHLAREKNLVVAPLTNEGQLCKAPDASRPLKLMVDANRYFADADENSPFTKTGIEKAWFSRPWIPLRCALSIKWRNSVARPVAEAVRDVRVTWSWADEAQNLDLLMNPREISGNEARDFKYEYEHTAVYGRPQARSQGRKYIEATQKRIKEKLGDCGYANNARALVGGTLVDSHRDNATLAFRPALPMGKDAPDGGTFDAVFDDDAKGVVSRGVFVYYGTSMIAGDRYKVTAKIDPAKQKNASGTAITGGRKDAFDKLHKGLTKREITTSPFTVWRRLRVAAFVEWPARSATWDGGRYNLREIFEQVQKEYAMAYIEVVPSKPGGYGLTTLKPSEVKLEDKDFKTPATNVLPNGLAVGKRSIKELVDAFLTTKAVKFRGGSETKNYADSRGLYDDKGVLDKDEFSDAAVLPRLFTYPMKVAPKKALEPAQGVVPSMAGIIAYMFGTRIKNILAKIKSGKSSDDERANLADAWMLFQDWRAIDRTRSVIHALVQRAGDQLCTLLGGLITTAPEFGPTLQLRDAAGKAKVAATVFTWTTPATAVPTVLYEEPIPTGKTEPTATEYPQEGFPDLMNLMLIPEGRVYTSIRSELSAWVDGTSREAPRCASLLNLLYSLKLAPNNELAISDKFVLFAYQHFVAWYGEILEIPAKEKAAARFKDVPAEKRSVVQYIKTCAFVEGQMLEILQGETLGSLFDTMSVLFDQVLLKGIGCRLDREDYTDYADGMIIVDTLVTKPMALGNETYLVAGTSKGCPLGVVLVSHATAMEGYALYAHELAHVLFMDHWENAPGFAFDHDRSDRNCIMSYPLLAEKHVKTLDNMTAKDQQMINGEIATYGATWAAARDVVANRSTDENQFPLRVNVGNLKPHMTCTLSRQHFCGKCNLKLRGWEIEATVDGKPASELLLPGFSGEDLPEKFPYTPGKLPVPPGPVYKKPEVRLIASATKDDQKGVALAGVGVSYFPVKKGKLKHGQTVGKVGEFKMSKLEDFPTAAAYDDKAADDDAAFRVEVLEPNLTVSKVFVTLEALQPKYDKSKPIDWVPFAEPERPKRALVKVECVPLGTDAHVYRSPYIRLVTDEADYDQLKGTRQALLVTDLADGKNTDNDLLEILDQKVRVTYDPTLV